MLSILISEPNAKRLPTFLVPEGFGHISGHTATAHLLLDPFDQRSGQRDPDLGVVASQA